ncbi:MAG: SH3 domain-containing protein [Saprospiraceae bacterium]
MRLYIVVSLFIFSQNNLFSIERYSKGDTLFNWATKLNLRTTSDLNSEVVHQILQNEKIIVDQNKYSKEEDFLINKNAKNWEKAITGKWVKIIYKNQIGYLFDAYLSKYNFSQIQNSNNYISNDTILNKIGFEIFTRKKYASGIIIEEGVDTEWGETIYYIFDFSMEEAILFIKKEVFENQWGEQQWKLNLENSKIQMEESDDLNYQKLTIEKVKNLTIIVIEHGM